VPKKIVVVGAGASGAEIASAYGRFGTEVILVEMLDQLLPAEDKDIAKIVERAFRKQNIEIVLGTKVESVEAGKNSVKVKYGDQEAEVDYLCIAGGRAPDTEGLGLSEAGVQTEKDGRVKVDDYQRTSNDKVFAIGDMVRGPALAHKASEEGVVAVETIAGQRSHPLDLAAVPAATFCHPQVASFGLTEAQARDAGRDIKVGKFQLGGVGGGTVYDDRQGIIKIVADAEYGEILGAHIVGNVAADMISELVDTKELEGGYQELARIIHPHPTISEAVLDAARAVDGWAIHQ
jgi:dihydrolipoamide dehydrogenase